MGSVDEVRESDFGRSGYLHYGLGNKHKNEELGLFVLWASGLERNALYLFTLFAELISGVGCG